MCHIVICCPHGSTIFFSVISHIMEGGSCDFFFKLVSKTVLNLRRTDRDTIKNVHGLQVKYSLFLSDFNETCIFSPDFRKILKYKI